MSRKVNLLFVDIYSDLKAGGAQVVFVNIVKAIDTEKFNISVACPSGNGGKLARALPDYVDHWEYNPGIGSRTNNRILNLLGYFLGMPYVVLKMVKKVRQKKIDILYANTPIAAFHMALVSRMNGIPLVYHEHDAAYHRADNIISRVMFSYVVRTVSVVIAISEVVAESLIEVGVSQEKIHIVYNGIDTGAFSEECRAVMREKGKARLNVINGNMQVVGVVGHIRRWKGQLLFLQTLPLVQRTVPNLKYVLIGGYHDQDYLDEIYDYVRANGLEGRVDFMGHQEDVYELIAALDILVIPSMPEPFGLVALEAMLLEKPVIAFNIGGPAEIISNQETGVLVNAGDIEAMAYAIMRLLGNKVMMRNMGMEGRKRLDEYFSLGQQCEKIQRLLLGVAS